MRTPNEEDFLTEFATEASRIFESWSTKIRHRLHDPIALLYWSACVRDLTALKPGNVHCYADGHGLTTEHFLASAYASASTIAHPALGLGQRIIQSVRATQEAVATNTNLGIILLCAPIVHGYRNISQAGLRQSIQNVITESGVEDAELILNAIRIASPSGLGESAEHDVFEHAAADIQTIMKFSESRDLISRQYSNGFLDIFETGFAVIEEVQAKKFGRNEIATAVYLTYLSRFHDSHVLRQHGSNVAEEIKSVGEKLYAHCNRANSISDMHDELMYYDTEWKRRHINPGTSADLTVATLFAHSIESRVN